ncbi:MAG: hypothetical protein R3Y29_08195, partial [bacterium]
KILKVKHLMINSKLQLKDLYVYFSSDYYIIFYITTPTPSTPTTIISITQDDFFTYIQHYPVNTKIYQIINIIEYNNNNRVDE